VNDIRDYYARSKVFVAPMQIGTGLQNKILEAMSMSLPCIVSSLAQGGIQAENNKNIFVADDPVKISELIILLLSNEKLRNSVGENAREFIVNNYDWEKIIDNFDKYLSSLVNKNKTL
jgi:glycosyltransferase involved in cell wall biosynthesis